MIINKDDHKSIYSRIFDKVVKERFVEIKELTHEIDHDDLICYFKNNTPTKNLMILKMIEIFGKIKSGEIKLEDLKELQSIFKTNLNDISKERFKSEEQQKSALGNINCFTNHIKLLLNYLIFFNCI